jgi:hypothetical protein
MIEKELPLPSYRLKLVSSLTCNHYRGRTRRAYDGILFVKYISQPLIDDRLVAAPHSPESKSSLQWPRLSVGLGALPNASQSNEFGSLRTGCYIIVTRHTLNGMIKIYSRPKLDSNAARSSTGLPMRGSVAGSKDSSRQSRDHLLGQ